MTFYRFKICRLAAVRPDHLLGGLRKAGAKAEATGLARGVMCVTVRTGVSVTFWSGCNPEVYQTTASSKGCGNFHCQLLEKEMGALTRGRNRACK